MFIDVKFSHRFQPYVWIDPSLSPFLYFSHLCVTAGCKKQQKIQTVVTSKLQDSDLFYSNVFYSFRSV